MNDFKKPQHSYDVMRFFAGLLVVGVLFAISTVVVRAAYGMYQTFSIAASEAANTAYELATLQAQHARLEATLTALGTPRGIEAAVRERFGVVKPGEGEIQIIRDENTDELEGAIEPDNVLLQFFQSLFVW